MPLRIHIRDFGKFLLAFYLYMQTERVSDGMTESVASIIISQL